MALFQTDNARGFIQSSRPLSAGVEMVARMRFVFTTALLFAADRLELGIIPPFCRVTNAILLGDTGAVNAVTVGLMSGTPGVNDNARTVGNEFFTAVSANGTVTRMVNPAGFKLPALDIAQAIGMTFSANVAASAANSVELLLSYAADR
jgi:hypothetical protein